MEILYIAIGFMVITLVYQLVIAPNIRIKKVFELLQKYDEQDYLLNVVKNRNFDFTLENQNILILIKIIDIPGNSMVTINSKETWRLSWGGNPNKLGRVYPRTRYMNEIVPFIREVIKTDKPVLKLFILYPQTEKILRYLNESELEIVDAKNMAYGYKVTTYQRFVQDFDDIINIK